MLFYQYSLSLEQSRQCRVLWLMKVLQSLDLIHQHLRVNMSAEMGEKASIFLFFFSGPNLKQFFPSCFCVLSSSGNILSPLREITQNISEQKKRRSLTGRAGSRMNRRTQPQMIHWSHKNTLLVCMSHFSCQIYLQGDRLEFRRMQLFHLLSQRETNSFHPSDSIASKQGC